MVELVTNALYKTIGSGCLSWKELEEVLVDVEVTLNNRPLGYVEDDVQLPLLNVDPMAKYLDVPAEQHRTWKGTPYH